MNPISLNRAAALNGVCMMAMATALGAAPTMVSAQTESSGPSATTTSTTVGEIIVTANKRSQRLVAVPGTVNAITGATLQKKGIEQFSDYINEIPGMSSTAAAAPGHGQPVLRGISTGAGQNAPTVSIYLDETPFTATSPLAATGYTTFDPDLADIDHIEVLKGPQSTLYGASSLGGLIKIVTKQPSFSGYEGSVSAEGSAVDHGGLGYALRASVNVPIIDDRVALRVSAVAKEDPGFVNNVNPHTGAKYTNESKVDGVRGSLRIDITPSIVSTFTILDQEIKGGSFGYEYASNTTLQPAFGKYNYTDYFPTSYKTDYFSAANTTVANLGWADLTNSLSLAQTNDQQQRDYSFYNILVPALAGSAIKYSVAPRSLRVTDEARISSKPGKLEWLIGSYVTRETDTANVLLRAYNTTTGLQLAAPNNNVYTFDAAPVFDEQAVFGDLTYHLTDKFEVSGGIRYSQNQQHYIATRSGLLGSAPLAPVNSTDGATNYSFTASYHPTHNSTLYAKAASAYRPGSSQVVSSPTVPAKYGADTLWNYEVGAKGSLLDGKLSGDVALYHIDWRNIQLNSRVNGFTVISNAGSATSDGVEATFSYRPTESLTLGGHGAYNYAKLTSNDVAIGAYSGDQLPFAPRYTAGVDADYSIPITSSLTGDVGASYDYQGARYTSFSKDPTNTRFNLAAYSTLDLRASMNWSRYSVWLRVENATDEHAYSSVQIVRLTATQAQPAWATLIQPQTVTIGFGAKF